MNFEDIARSLHEYESRFAIFVEGGKSLPEWDNAPGWQKKLARDMVKFHLDSPNATLEQAHKHWKKDMKKNGWTHGPTRNDATRTHPGITSFFDLPARQQQKQEKFKEHVHAMVKHP